MKCDKLRANYLKKIGYTYQDIADELGVSKQYIGTLFAGQGNHGRWTRKTWNSCIYKGLKYWLDYHQYTQSRLSVEMGYNNAPKAKAMVKRKFSNNGSTLTIHEIKKLIKITGKTFEELFEEVQYE